MFNYSFFPFIQIFLMLLSTKCSEDRFAWPEVRGQTCVAGGCKFELVSTTLSNKGILEYMEGEGVGVK